MKNRLKFWAKEDLLVSLPNSVRIVGQPARYVGRKFDPSTKGYPATKEPYECEAKSREGRRLISLMRRESSLYPADQETAEICGVPYNELEFKSSVWKTKDTNNTRSNSRKGRTIA